MDLKQLLQIKLTQDITQELKKLYPTHNPSDYLSLLSQSIKSHIDLLTIDSKDFFKDIHGSDNRCCSRVWNNHRGSRCTFKKIKGDYCQKHNDMIDTLGYLRFGRYDEPRPRINEKGNIIPWYDYQPMKELDIIIQYQHSMLQKLIKDI